MVHDLDLVANLFSHPFILGFLGGLLGLCAEFFANEAKAKRLIYWLVPGSAWRLAHRVKSAAGGNQANKPIRAAALMGAPSCTWLWMGSPTCSRLGAPAWAFPNKHGLTPNLLLVTGSVS